MKKCLLNFLKSVEEGDLKNFNLAMKFGSLIFSSNCYELALLVCQNSQLAQSLIMNHNYSATQLLNILKAKIREKEDPKFVKFIVGLTKTNEKNLFTNFLNNPNLLLTSFALNNIWIKSYYQYKPIW